MKKVLACLGFDVWEISKLFFGIWHCLTQCHTFNVEKSYNRSFKIERKNNNEKERERDKER